MIGRIIGADWSAGAVRCWDADDWRGLDWALLADAAARHAVRPLTAAAAREAGWPGTPPGERVALEAAERQCVTNTMCQVSALRRIIDAATTDGIRVLALKGLGLADHLYGNVFLREAVDIDLLVHPRDFLAMEALLVDLGCVSTDTTSHALTPRQRAVMRGLHHHSCYTLADPGVTIEVHWALDRNRHMVATDFDMLWIRRRRASLFGIDVGSLSGDDLIHYVGMHATRHGWEQWKWVADMAALVRIGGYDRQQIRERTGATLFDSWLMLVEAVTGGLADRDAEGEIAASSASRRLAEHALRIGRETRPSGAQTERSRQAHASLAAYRLRLPTTPAGRLFELRYAMHDERDWRAVRIPDPFFPLYYVLRPFTFVGRRAGELLASLRDRVRRRACRSAAKSALP